MGFAAFTTVKTAAGAAAKPRLNAVQIMVLVGTADMSGRAQGAFICRLLNHHITKTSISKADPRSISVIMHNFSVLSRVLRAARAANLLDQRFVPALE